MSFADAKGAPWPGDGLVARMGANVLVVGAPYDPEVARALLHLCRSSTGSGLVRNLAQVALDPPSDGPHDFGVVTPEGSGCIAFVRGRVVFTAEIEGASVELRGEDVVTWIDRVIDTTPAYWRLGCSGAESSAGGLLELGEGVVSGAGISIGTPPDAALPASDAAAPDESFETVFEPDPSFHSIRIEADESLIADREPLPVAGEPADTAENAAPDADRPPRDPDAPPPVLVKGYRCPRNHHNRPGAHYCSTCGIKMGVHKTLVLVDGERPPLGVLVFDDGATVPVVDDMIIGREPDADPLVQGHKARPVRIEDDTQSISRAHLHVLLDAWDAYVIDRGSSNGTRVRGDGGEWSDLQPEARQLISTGSVIMLGEREVRFDQHHVR